MYRKLLSFMLSIAFTLSTGSAVLADDGTKTLKSMSRNTSLTVLPEDVGVPTAEAEHAFTDMMKFYVPAQQASGVIEPVAYNDADANLVETLPVAKPLVSVFINGPALGVEGTAFAHSFMDAFAAVSLDDGETWKTTNLSESADQSSFELGQASSGSGAGSTSALVSSSTSNVSNSSRPGGFLSWLLALARDDDRDRDDRRDDHDDDNNGVLQIEEAEWNERNRNLGVVGVEGDGADSRARVTLINAVTQDELASTRADRRGRFDFDVRIRLRRDELPPCSVAAVSNGVTSALFRVVDEDGKTLEQCVGDPGYDLTNYPGGVHNVVMATQGNKVLVAWPSRYCQQGKPAYALGNDLTRRDAIVNFIQTGTAADDNNVTPLSGFNLDDDLYLVDAFGVAGSQGSIDFADEEYPQAGEVPYGCVWTARGVLLAGDDPRTTDTTESSHMVWTKAERLTSGRRDPYRLEVHGVKGAGFVLTWQEDPEGLRPGQGEGPGEGWSGAVAHSQTDVWYSFINWQYFDYVDNGEGAPINIASHDLTTTGRPQVFVPMAIPMRLTNNAKCNTDGTEVTDPDMYCNYGTGDTTDGVADAADFGLKDQCADTVEIPTGPNDTPTPICVSEDGLPNVANTASTRPRAELKGYDSNNDGIIDKAWVIVASEESKGLGRFFFLPDGTPCEEGSSDDCQEDIGKNQWYFSFDMGSPDTSADLSDTGLVRNLVSQGNMLNQPEIDWRTGEFYPVMNTLDMWDFDAYNFDIYNTEIARRSSLLVQDIAKAGASGLLALPSWKQGPMRQGGPADTMFRRIVDQGTSVNPYAFTNMVCEYPDGSSGWVLTDGSNP
ncbi:MAG: choice-of-anchor O protein, partial [Thioalkalispiraceae bacterium]